MIIYSSAVSWIAVLIYRYLRVLQLFWVKKFPSLRMVQTGVRFASHLACYLRGTPLALGAVWVAPGGPWSDPLPSCGRVGLVAVGCPWPGAGPWPGLVSVLVVVEVVVLFVLLIVVLITLLAEDFLTIFFVE